MKQARLVTFIALLGLLVLGLLRSHALIMKALHELGALLERLDRVVVRELGEREAGGGELFERPQGAPRLRLEAHPVQ